MNDTAIRRIFRKEAKSRLILLGDLNRPDWADKSPHCWEKYVPDPVRTVWDSLPEESKLAVVLTANEVAEREVWE